MISGDCVVRSAAVRGIIPTARIVTKCTGKCGQVFDPSSVILKASSIAAMVVMAVLTSMDTSLLVGTNSSLKIKFVTSEFQKQYFGLAL